MQEKIINILVIEQDPEELAELLDILESPGHNIFRASYPKEAFSVIEKREVAIIICDLDIPDLDGPAFINQLNRRKETSNSNVIVTSHEAEKVYAVVEGLNKGAVDYLLKPWIPNLVRAKLSVYKRLYFKRQRVNKLLENILPAQTLHEFREYGKSSPKKFKNATVLFTDFVKFTEKTRTMDPQTLIQKLDYYFSRFDEIILKYKLEKIKTIGDAYMAVGGVTEKDPHVAIRTALAAMEMQNFILNDILTKKALGQEYWELRVGIHSGDLIAGVVGTHKFTFDVWGDTVNVAARCEQNSEANKISVSVDFYEQIKDLFDCTPRGEISIKNRGKLQMYFIDQLKPEHSFYGRGVMPNAKLRGMVGLPEEDFEGLRSFIINKIKAELDDALIYHSYEHTLDVEEAVLKYAKLEGLTADETILVRTAALFHDTGFLLKYNDNESIGAQLARKYCPDFGYTEEHIRIIEDIILSTSYDIEPKNIMEKVMSDADHDYLGRADYHVIVKKLFRELEHFGNKMTEREKIEAQISYLEHKHQFYTTSALNLRQPGKENRIEELKKMLEEKMVGNE